MALKYLDMPLDIHGGGSDLIFPHHENEIAQSEGATGNQPFSRFWMHTGMVYLGGAKMSKSLGNMVFVRDLTPEYGADAVRLYLSGCHYRAELHYDDARIRAARQLADYLAEAASVHDGLGRAVLDVDTHRRRFLERMDDDLDTPGAIHVLQDLADEIKRSSEAGHAVHAAQDVLRELSGVLGLRLQPGE